MNNKVSKKITQSSTEDLNKIIIDAILDTKGVNIKFFDLTALEMASTEYFIVCHGNSTTHLNGIVKNIEKKVYEYANLKPSRSEGMKGNNWLLLDYFSVVVHVFSEEKRTFYNIENLWSDAIITTYNNE